MFEACLQKFAYGSVVCIFITGITEKYDFDFDKSAQTETFKVSANLLLKYCSRYCFPIRIFKKFKDKLPNV